MAQQQQNLKGIRASKALMGLGCVLLSVSACEAIGSRSPQGADLPPAPKTVDVQEQRGDQATSSSAAADTARPANSPAQEMPALPTPPTQAAYGAASDAYWRDAEARGLVVTETSPAEYTQRYLNGDYAKPATQAQPVTPTSATFTGETYSVVNANSAPTPRYVTADGQPYPEEFEQAQSVRAPQSFETASAEYSAYRETRSPDAYRASSYNNAGNNADNRGGYALHLASYKIEANAVKGWRSLAQRHGSVLGGLEPRLSYADIPGKGAYLRLKAGPFASRAAAGQACSAIKAAGDYCAVMVFDGTGL